jgi:hypothetical protein
MDQTTSSRPSPPAAEKAPTPWLSALLRPIRGFRLSYLPLAMVFFAHGALALIDVARDIWIKEKLTLSPAELAGIGVWLNLPWTVKMVFGELVDSVPIFGTVPMSAMQQSATINNRSGPILPVMTEPP